MNMQIADILKGEDMNDFLIDCAMGEKGFKKFCERVLQLEIMDFHLEWFNAYHYRRRSCIIAATGHGKTWVIGMAYTLWYIFFNRQKQVLIVAHNLEHAMKILESIRDGIENNELLQSLKPKQSVWTKTELNTTTGCKVFCKACTPNIRGVHVDRILCDEAALFSDPLLFYTIIVPRATRKKGHICVISTPASELDLTMQLIENKQYWAEVYPAEDEAGNILWPSVFSRKDLDRIRDEIGEYAYNREYLCKPLPIGTPLYPPELVKKALNMKLKLYQYEKGIKIKDNCIYMIGCDFAISGSKQAAWSAFIAVEKNYDTNKIIIKEMIRKKGYDTKVQATIIEKLTRKWHGRQIWIDSSTFGQTYLQNLRKEKGLPVVAKNFDRNTRTDLLINLRNAMDKGWLVIPFNKEDQNTMELSGQLKKELLSMAADSTEKTHQTTFKSYGETSDMVMALALAVTGAVKQMKMW